MLDAIKYQYAVDHTHRWVRVVKVDRVHVHIVTNRALYKRQSERRRAA